MKRLMALLAAMTMVTITCVPFALAQEAETGTNSQDQYPLNPGGGTTGSTSEPSAAAASAAASAAAASARDKSDSGADAYAAALRAARKTGVGDRTARIVASRAVSDNHRVVAHKDESPRITRLPDTSGGSIWAPLAGACLIAGGILMVVRSIRR